VVVGDVHGDLDRYVEVLTMAGILDSAQKWAGGNAVLVQLGDMVDRGPDSRGVIELLQRLDKEAKKAKGKVYPLIGNHEAMRMYGDLRYVPPAEYETFRTPKSEEERDKWFQHASQAAESRGTPIDRQKWESEHPLGQSEFLDAFSARGEYGRWILSLRAVLVYDNSLFLHGGISPRFADWPEGKINSRVRDELSSGLPPADGLCRSEDGPLWYRGLASAPESEIAAHVDHVLQSFKVKRIVVGHTPQLQGIVSRLGGKVILADAGLSKYFGGHKACVVIENGEPFALDGGKKTALK